VTSVSRISKGRSVARCPEPGYAIQLKHKQKSNMGRKTEQAIFRPGSVLESL